MIIHAIILPILLTFAPWILTRYVLTTPRSRRMPYMQAAPYLLAAAIVWEVGLLLPSVEINSQTETFLQHFMGGAASGILFYFVVKAYGLQLNKWWQKPVLLYFFVCGLGVANELLELFMDQAGLMIDPVHRNDTWWDLLANTIGAGVAFFCAELYRHMRGKIRPSQ